MSLITEPNQLNQDLPANGRIIAIDLGTKRIGLAISDETRFLANPKIIINRQNNIKDLEKIKNFVEENKAIAIVIGFPLTMEGNEQEMSILVKNFAKELDQLLEKKLPICLFEERLSSFEARSFHSSKLSRKKNKFYDDIAASVILQHFLDDLRSQH